MGPKGKACCVFMCTLVVVVLLVLFLYPESPLNMAENMNVKNIPYSETTAPAPGFSSDHNVGPFNVDNSVTKGCLNVDRRDQVDRKHEFPLECKPGEEKIGFICYNKCPDKWKMHPDFPDTCQRCKDYSDSCDFLDMIVQKRTRTGTAVECKPGTEKIGGLCYFPCPGGYKSEGSYCLRCTDQFEPY